MPRIKSWATSPPTKRKNEKITKKVKKKKRLWYVIDCKRSLLFLLILLSLLLLSSLLYCHCYCYYDYRHAHFRGIIHVQSAMANSARHSCFYFLSVAMEREDSRKKKRKREQYGVINSRTTDRENFRLIPRDIFQCSKEDSPWRKWGILGKRNFENSTRFSRFFRVRKIGRSIKISDHRSSRCTLFFFT